MRADMLTLVSVIPYVTDEQANAATKDPHLKLLFRLIKFQIMDEGTSLGLPCVVKGSKGL